MKIIRNLNDDAYYNLALEEYLIDNFDDDIFLLWRNENSIIIGKNQNAYSEVNVEDCTHDNIKIVRRLTGGGAVFHDLGNINFTFIYKDNGEFGDFHRFCEPIIDFLKSLGLNAEVNGRNDMVIDGLKFSGNAQCVRKGRIMHHGTILFSSNMNNLAKYLKVHPEKIKSKGIKSVSSRVTNIYEHLTEKMDVTAFFDKMFDYMLENEDEYILSQEQIDQVKKLRDEKYSTFEWNIGYFKNYSFSNTKKLESGLISVNFECEKGKISSLKIEGDFFGYMPISDIEQSLIGVNHNLDDILKVINRFDVNKYILNSSAEELCDMFF